AIAQQLIGRDGGIVLLHDFAAATEFIPAGLTEADLDLRIIEITTLLIERLRGAGFSFAGPPARRPWSRARRPLGGLRPPRAGLRPPPASRRRRRARAAPRGCPPPRTFSPCRCPAPPAGAAG